jgi:hypothetical protein
MFASTTDFQDTKQGVAKLLYIPLVDKSTYEQYKAAQGKVDRKRAERELIEVERQLAFLQKEAPHVAEYMLTAWNIRKYPGASPTIPPGLDARVLDRWVKLLEPEGAPPHFEAWFKVALQPKAVTLPAVAAQYQKQYEDKLVEWTKKVEKWQGQATKAIAANGNPPGRPSLDAENAPFFYAASFEEGPFDVEYKDFAAVFGKDFAAQVDALKKAEAELKKELPPEPDMACAVEEGPVVDQKVFVRGDYASEGEPAPKVFPAVLRTPQDPAVAQGSGRLELAEWLVTGKNPLTARVMVNRLWLGHFGEGIVRSPDNFGKMGERPTHPELLDWLSTRFVEGGWSVKKMQKLMMMSAAYQMSSDPSAESTTEDAENRLLQHFNRRRLDVEEIRDAMLAIDGSIDYGMGGTLQKGFGTDGENSNGRLSLNPEKVKRRMVYLPLRRSNLPSLLNLFDFGDAVTPIGKRVLTNVAPQALFAMNSTFIQERAATIAKQLMAESTDSRVRIREAYRMILNRAPEDAEIDDLISYIARFEQKFPTRGEAIAWQSVSHILLASSEFIYLD